MLTKNRTAPLWGASLIALNCVMDFGAAASAQETNSAQLEEIVVTARRYSENIQKVPVAITAYSAKALEEKGVSTIAELEFSSPNTTLQVSRGTNSTLTAYIRGIGQQDPLWGFEPGVGIYIDDVYIARPQGAVLDVLDISSIEVLRGPQGTLYGKNTIGGALKYNTKRLTSEPSLNVEARYGSYGQMDVVGSGSVALTDKIFVGISGATLNRNGFGSFTQIAGNPDNYNKDIVTGRIKVELHPAESVFIRLTADQTDDDSNAKGGHREVASLLTGREPPRNVYDSQAGMSTENHVGTKGVSGLLEWDVTEQLQLKSITAYRKGHTETNIDFDGSELNTFDVAAPYNDKQTTQEFQGTFRGDKLTMVGGLYYFDGTACGYYDAVLGQYIALAAFGGATLENGGCVDTKSYSAYLNGSYKLTDKLSLDLGGRYTEDKKTASVYYYTYLGVRLPGNPGTSVLFPPVNSDFTVSDKWKKFTPSIGVNFQATDDVMIFADFKTGYKSGGFNMRSKEYTPALNPFARTPFAPETVNTYEVGIKSQFLDNRVRLNATAFYNDYKDLQATVFRPVPNAAPAQVVENAGKAKAWGIEVEGSAAVTDALTLTGSLGYIDPKIKEWLSLGVDISSTVVVSNTPKLTTNLGASYRMSLGDWKIVTNADWAHRSQVHMFEALNPTIDQGAIDVVNAGVSLMAPDGHWTIGLYGKNIFDKRYRVAGYADSYSLPASSAIPDHVPVAFYGDPATVTLSIKYKY